MSNLDQKDLPIYFIRHAADFVGCHPNTITNYIREGFIKPIRDKNGNRRFTKIQLKKLRKIFKINNPDELG